jgi:hypothetical protein
MTLGNDYIEFVYAVRGAGKVFFKIAPQLRKEASSGLTANLINHLRSGRPLTPIDRNELADLLAGEFKPRPGRPLNRSSERERRRKTCARVFALEDEWRGEGRKQPLHEQAIKEVARALSDGPKEFRATAAEIQSWIVRLSSQERANIRAKYLKKI